ncbi:MAG: hypothetical protein JKY65_02010, partial [Planctomycetes bacterium]|nr:hypothetical protein [Planctomycetota bacterium]
SEVSATPAYAGYEGEALVRSSFLRHFDPRGTDTGRPRRSRIYPAAGLAVPTGSPEQLSAVDRRIREQVLADATLRVRLRVGTHEGAPTLESGSTLTLSTESGTLTATLPRTLVSVDSTSKPETWLPVRGFHVKVKRGAYRTAIRRLVASFLQRALRDALGPVYARASLIQR